jgi:hypothetical protein
MTEPSQARSTAAWLFARYALKAAPGRSSSPARFGLTASSAPRASSASQASPSSRRGPAPIVGPQTKSPEPPLGRRVAAAGLVGIALAASLAVIALTARNCRVMDGAPRPTTPAGTSPSASPWATGRFETLRASDGCPVVTGQVQQDRCWMQEGLGWIKVDPWRWLAHPEEAQFTFDHESFPMGYLGEANPSAWPPERQAFGRTLTTFHAALLASPRWPSSRGPGLGRGMVRSRRIANAVQVGVLLLIVALTAAGTPGDERTLAARGRDPLLRRAAAPRGS